MDEPMIEGIDHVNLVVRDLATMTAFYCEAMECRVTKQVTISGEWIASVVGLQGVVADVVYLDFPMGPRIELIRYRTPEGANWDALSNANSFGIRHIAFRVTDISAAAKRLCQAGVELRSEIATVPQNQVSYEGNASKRLVYFEDPEGNLLELCEYS
jgi:catechol 2,3-dioxygenase-like lactoylglutathione lyase family enzyme